MHFNLSSSSPEGEDLFNDTQIRVTGLMELKRCMKMFRNLNGRRGAKFPAMTLSYFTVTIAHLYAFSEILKLEASPVEGQSLLQKDNKRRKRKGKRIKLVRQSQIVQSVMQDYQYDLSHLLPVCNLLAQGPKITYNYCLSRRSGLLW